MSAKVAPAVFETSSGAKIYRIPLEAFPGFWACAYLVQNAQGIFLIDCGSDTEPSHKNLLEGLSQAGFQPSDLTHILLTHAHIDHYGGLTKLKPLTNAKIGCHELDVQTVAHHEARLALISRRLASFLAETGLPKEEAESLLGIYRFTKAIYRSVPVDLTYEAVGMRVAGFELIHLPGHCPGHAAIRLDDIIFCGDMIVEGVTPHLSPGSINPYSGLDHYLSSLTRFQEWSKPARLILNGHDEVITDLAFRIDATRKNLLRRISKTITSLSEPLTIAEVATAVYGKTSGYNQLLVIEKTGAYIEYLYEYGMIEIVNADEMEQGQPAKYHVLGDALAHVEKNVYR